MSDERMSGAGEAAADRQFVEELRRTFTLAATTSALAAPLGYSQLLEKIVDTAAKVLDAQAASLLLLDEDKRELVFEVALGPRASEVKKFRIPLGHGIAGLVASSGQPMAVCEVEKDPRLATEIARAVGYIPSNILCIPLVSRDTVIGVLEAFDKRGGASFSPADMELFGQFGSLASVAIEQGRTHRNLTLLIREVLTELTGGAAPGNHEFQEKAHSFLTHMEHEDAAYHRALDLARLVREVGEYGDNELEACQAILTGFLDYLKRKPAEIGLPGSDW